MKWEETKSWPYPVLRPNSGDYQKAAFEVTVEVARLPDTTAVEVDAEFALGDAELGELLERGEAEYLLLVRCSTTHYRGEFRSHEPHIRQQFENGILAGRVEFAPFVVASDDLQSFRSTRWHSDYDDVTPQFNAGSVLAIDRPYTCWIDTADEEPVTLMFRVAKGNVPAGQWRCKPEEEHVALELSDGDYDLLKDARSRVGNTSELAYLINGLYLPALIWLLDEADRGSDDSDYADMRWYRALNSALERNERKALGATDADRAADAQVLLQNPFAEMPILKAGQVRDG